MARDNAQVPPVNDKDGSQATYSSLFSSHRIASLFYLLPSFFWRYCFRRLIFEQILLQSQPQISSAFSNWKVRDLGSGHFTRPRLAPSVDLTRSKGLHNPP